MARPKNESVLEEGLSPESAVSADVEKPKTPEPLPPMTQDNLLSIIASMQQQMLTLQQQNAENTKLLADAVIQASTPKLPSKTKKQEADEQNERMFKTRELELEKAKKAVVHREQYEACDHIAGSNPLSEQRDIAGRTSIAWHRNDVGVEQGICTICQRVFLPHQKDYVQWRKRPSFCKLSAAGNRVFLDQARAWEQSYLHDIE